MSEYEFSESQNVVIRDLARKMRVVGILFCLLGLLYLLAAAGTFLGALQGHGSVALGAHEHLVSVGAGAGNLIAAVIYLAIGLWTGED